MIIIFVFGSEWNWMQALGAAILTIGTLMAQLPEKRSGPESAHQL
jgi:drug/metabolite transporter (DMT)-like permease